MNAHLGVFVFGALALGGLMAGSIATGNKAGLILAVLAAAPPVAAEETEKASPAPPPSQEGVLTWENQKLNFLPIFTGPISYTFENTRDEIIRIEYLPKSRKLLTYDPKLVIVRPIRLLIEGPKP